MPKILKGKSNNQTNGYKTKAIRASGQQTINSKHHNRKLNM